jgi:hypothetical protein
MKFRTATDIFLLPKTLYVMLTQKKGMLYPGIILVGIADLIFSLVNANKNILAGKSQNAIYYNITLFALFAVIYGFMDVLFFSIPIFDLFKKFPKETGFIVKENLLIKIMKVYIIANFLVLPLNIVFYIVNPETGHFFGHTGFLDSILAVLTLISFIWYNAIISRGVNAIYRFQPIFKRLVFITALIWSYLLSIALDFIFDKVMLTMLK